MVDDYHTFIAVGVALPVASTTRHLAFVASYLDKFVSLFKFAVRSRGRMTAKVTFLSNAVKVKVFGWSIRCRVLYDRMERKTEQGHEPMS